MNLGRGSGLAWWSAATIFVSAFLLFQVQPVISKTILPWFGGSPAVWTTALLFFQTALLAGYAYAHVLIRYVPLARQPLVHLGLLLLALLTLPITPSNWWKPGDGMYPELRILALLAAKVGPTYFLLSATGPLVQAWFAQAYPQHSPYRLYALSNVGSLAALLSYPFLFEIMLTVETQGILWSLGFVVFAGLISMMGLGVWKLADEARQRAETLSKLPESIRPVFERPAADDPPPFWLLRLAWVLLAALGSTALLAITNHVCQDISVDPFMWVVPLSLYLLSFIICFDSEWWYVRKFWAPLAILGILALAAINNGESVRYELEQASKPNAFAEPASGEPAPPVAKAARSLGRAVVRPVARPAKWVWNRIVPTKLTAWYDDNLIAQAVGYVSVLFLICMVCHGELVKSKPQPRHLTMFFLMISAGGALGGLFVAVICPLAFKTFFELSLVIVLGFLVAWIALANDGRDSWLKGRDVLQWAAALVVVSTTLLVAKANYEEIDKDRTVVRNFYGTLAVEHVDRDDPLLAVRKLYHGRILHGVQFDDPAREMEPNTYYVADSGVGLAVEHYPREDGRGMRVAVIGLGTGTMAAHGRQGDEYRFYDIDPKVVAISDEFFTYRKKTAARTEVVLGDARIRMEREPPQNYDLIVLDAFSGDAIPGHLLTVEAFVQYLRHLHAGADGRPTGIIAVHISNRYIDLEPVVAALARKFELPAKVFHVEAVDENDSGDAASDWILLSRNGEFWKNPLVGLRAKPLGKTELLWTDQQRSLLPIWKHD